MIEFTHDTEYPISIPCDDVHLNGLLHIPSSPKGMVIFAHGSGSSRFSPRNQYIAKVLKQSKIGTLLFDLLTPKEDEIDSKTSQYRFDINFLANRLVASTNFLTKNPSLQKVPMGYFGASTGGGAALVAAARLSALVKAVVSRGGRPDLAAESLAHVKAPTLLIVGSLDEPVIKLNRQAYEKMHGIKKLEIIIGATHLFEEPGKLAAVARLADDWFRQYLV
jgi:putative phosphoribosyl transferase